MKKLKGPELKMPELKTPDFLNDLYYDLRDRRLLPVVALVLVAIVAVPFLLGGDSYVEAPSGGLSSLGAEKTSKLTVVEATPGLRDYHTRLGDRSPTDPFEQRYTGLPPAAQVSSEGSIPAGEGGSVPTVTSGGGGGGGEAPAPTRGETTEGGSGGGGSSDGETGSGDSQAPRLVQIVVDVQISHQEIAEDGTRKMSEPEVRERVRPFTQLPGEKTAVVTPVGISFHTGKIFFLVSNDVKSLGGDFDCVTRTPSGLCELLEIGRGMLLEARYGPENVLYQFKVTGIDVARDGRAGDNRAPRATFALPAGTTTVLP